MNPVKKDFQPPNPFLPTLNSGKSDILFKQEEELPIEKNKIEDDKLKEDYKKVDNYFHQWRGHGMFA